MVGIIVSKVIIIMIERKANQLKIILQPAETYIFYQKIGGFNFCLRVELKKKKEN